MRSIVTSIGLCLLLFAGACGEAGVIHVPQDVDDGTPGTCTPGEITCNGATERRCRADGSGWDTETCAVGCQPGTGCLSSTCTPGSRQCLEPKLAQLCDAAGQAQLTVCDHGCLNGHCVDVACSAGLSFCEPGGSKVLRCSNDGLTVTEVDQCPHGCNAADATCKDPACATGEVRCSTAGHPEICNEDRTAFEATDVICAEKCVDGQCYVSSCQAGTRRCGANGVELCKSDGSGYTLDEQCEWGCLESNMSNAVCAQCPPGAYRCDGLDIQYCDNPFQPWQTIDACDAIDTCVQGTCVEVVTLVGNATQDSVLLLLVEALADCWLRMEEAPKEQDDEVCRGLNTQAMDGDLSKQEIATWFCDNQSDGLLSSDDFVTPEHFAAAKDVLGCGILDLDDLTIDTLNKKIHAQLAQAECIAYNKGDSEIIVAPCEDLP